MFIFGRFSLKISFDIKRNTDAKKYTVKLASTPESEKMKLNVFKLGHNLKKLHLQLSENEYFLRFQ